MGFLWSFCTNIFIAALDCDLHRQSAPPKGVMTLLETFQDDDSLQIEWKMSLSALDKDKKSNIQFVGISRLEILLNSITNYNKEKYLQTIINYGNTQILLGPSYLQRG